MQRHLVRSTIVDTLEDVNLSLHANSVRRVVSAFSDELTCDGQLDPTVQRAGHVLHRNVQHPSRTKRDSKPHPQPTGICRMLKLGHDRRVNRRHRLEGPKYTHHDSLGVLFVGL